MYINNVSKCVYVGKKPDSIVELWLDHGYKLGATHAILYFDKYDNCEAMSYVFPPITFDDLLQNLSNQGQSVIQCWQYQTDEQPFADVQEPAQAAISPLQDFMRVLAEPVATQFCCEVLEVIDEKPE